MCHTLALQLTASEVQLAAEVVQVIFDLSECWSLASLLRHAAVCKCLPCHDKDAGPTSVLCISRRNRRCILRDAARQAKVAAAGSVTHRPARMHVCRERWSQVVHGHCSHDLRVRHACTSHHAPRQSKMYRRKLCHDQVDSQPGSWLAGHGTCPCSRLAPELHHEHPEGVHIRSLRQDATRQKLRRHCSTGHMGHRRTWAGSAPRPVLHDRKTQSKAMWPSDAKERFNEQIAHVHPYLPWTHCE